LRKQLLLYFFLCACSSCYGQNWLWGTQGESKTIHDIGEGFSITIDKLNNIYLTGYFVDTITFGHDTITNNLYPRNDAFLVKYDSTGKLIWVRNSKTETNITSTCRAFTSATDFNENIYIGGSYGDSVIFYPDTLITSAESDIFITKYDNNGNVLWAKSSKSSIKYGNASCNSLSVDKKDNVYATGEYNDTLSLGVSNFYSPVGPSFYLVKYNSNGHVIWAKESNIITSKTTSTGNGLVNDRYGNIYVTGTFSDSIKFGAQLLTSKTDDFFLMKCDSNGNVIWAKDGLVANIRGLSIGNSICIDQNENLYVTGYFLDSISFGSHTLYSPKLYDFFVAKYDVNGNVIWAKAATVNDTNGWYGYSINVDTNGHLYLSCAAKMNSAYINLHYGNTRLTLNNTPLDPSLFLELDTAGNFVCGNILASNGDDQNTVACDKSGKYIYVGGDLVSSESYIFGKDTLTGNGGEYPFIARWQPCSDVSQGIVPILPEKENVTLFPNPNNGVFQLKIGHAELVSASQPIIEVYNILGEQVLNETLKQVQGDNAINLTSQPSGIYLYRVLKESGEPIGQGKIIIQK